MEKGGGEFPGVLRGFSEEAVLVFDVADAGSQPWEAT